MREHTNRSRLLTLAAAVALIGVVGALLAACAGEERAHPATRDGTQAPREQPSTRLYVAPWGHDTWPGTAELPLATLAGAQEAVRERTAQMDADIVVNLRGGTYALTDPLRFSAAAGDSGTGGHSVVYQAYGYATSWQETPIISGGQPVTRWRRAPDVDGAWQADVGGLETRQLFVDGRRAHRTALGGGLPGEAIRLPTGYATRSTVPQSWQHPEDLELVFNGGEEGLPYSEARCGVSGIRGDAKWTMVTVDEPCFSDLEEAYAAEIPGATLPAPTDVENSLSLLREPGTWYLDRSRPGHHVLYYMPLPGEDPRQVQIVAPVLEELVVGTGTADAPLHDVAFRGLTFSHATWLAPDEATGFPQIIGSWYYSGGRYKRVPGHVTFRAAERISLEGNHFTHLGGQALVLAKVGSGNTVGGNVIDDVSGGGVEVRDRAATTESRTTGCTTSVPTIAARLASPSKVRRMRRWRTTRSTTCRTRESGASPRGACTSSTTWCSTRCVRYPTAAASIYPSPRARPSTTGPWCVATWFTTPAASASTPMSVPTGSR